MEIIFRMTVRNMLPETINKASRRVGRPPAVDEHTNIQLQKVVDGQLCRTEEIEFGFCLRLIIGPSNRWSGV